MDGYDNGNAIHQCYIMMKISFYYLFVLTTNKF